MQETGKITAETTLSEKETRELIARLSEPVANPAEGQATVKDLAETLDLPEDEVIARLYKIRQEKEEKPVPEQVQKLAAALEQMHTPNYEQERSNLAVKIIVASFVLLILMAVGAFFSVGSTERRIAPPNITTMDKKGPAEELSHGP